MRRYPRFNSTLPRYPLLVATLIFLLASFNPLSDAAALEATVSDFTVANSEHHLLLYMSVDDWMTEEMEAAIHNGIPLTFAFYLDLFATRNRWPDRKIREYEFNHVMEYDSLKKVYIIHRDESGDSRVAASLAEARRLMSEINGFRLLPLAEMNPGMPYTLRAKAKMARKSMPLYFHYLIPFSSPWEFETEWRELTLKLVP